MKIVRRILDVDHAQHKRDGELYPLYGVLVMDDGERRIIERLPIDGDDPRYEVHAPSGRIFVGGEHSKLCHNLKDVREWGGEATEPDTGEVIPATEEKEPCHDQQKK